MSKDNEIDLASGNGIISSFTSSMLQQPHVPLVVKVQADVARMLLSHSGMTILVHQALLEGSQRRGKGKQLPRGAAYWLTVSCKVPTKSWKDPEEYNLSS